VGGRGHKAESRCDGCDGHEEAEHSHGDSPVSHCRSKRVVILAISGFGCRLVSIWAGRSVPAIAAACQRDGSSRF
jgi:hypothetical protein